MESIEKLILHNTHNKAGELNIKFNNFNQKKSIIENASPYTRPYFSTLTDTMYVILSKEVIHIEFEGLIIKGNETNNS